MLMTGSSDGVIKIYRNYESEKNVELVSAFRALTDLIPSNKNAGLVLDWQQGQGKLLVAGDVKVIRVWNAATEICTNVSLPPPYVLLSILTTSTRTSPPAPAPASPPSPPTKWPATSSAPATATAPSASSTRARSPPWRW